MNYTVKHIINISDLDIEDIMSSALAGIIYWSDDIKVQGRIKPEDKDMYLTEALIRGYGIRIRDAEEEKYHTLTLKKFLNGIALYGKDNFDDWDMYDVDTVIQFALFGKQVYS
mgnify:CR=1 FL=1|tara:strand:- start:29 stop:367 length:339 start_codon:yes stop_codon:yes gene_type:complete